MLQITKLTKNFGERVILEEAEAYFNDGERVSLVGPNGSGKTTFFKIITGEEHCDSGERVVETGARIGFLPQEIDSIRGKTVIEEVAGSSEEIRAIEAKMRELEHKMGGDDAANFYDEYSALSHRFEALDGYNVEHKAKRVLYGLGFKEKDFTRNTEEFSGGWLMRIALARLLVNPPDIMLLDEPTNHLDLYSLLWMQNFILSYKGILIFTSHDRDFVDNVSTRILEIDSGKLVSYKGNYNFFLEEKQKKRDILEKQSGQQQKEKERLQEFINRFRATASKAKSVQSKIKHLDKMEEIVVEKEKKTLNFAFPQPIKSGREVIALENLHKSYGSTKIYTGVDLSIERGDRIALVGVNGAGKSTLLKIMAGVLPFESGKRRLGFNVNAVYYPQYRLDVLNPDNTVLQELDSAAPMAAELSLRKMLGMFMFRGDDVFKEVKVLSGGEKSRLVLAKVLINPPNFILMDEPTNHLDIPSRDILIKALNDYTGTICFISHDVHFIRSISNKIVEVNNGRLIPFAGGYDYYVEKKKLMGETVGIPLKERTTAPKEKPAVKPAPQEKKKRVNPSMVAHKKKELAARIEEINLEMTVLHAKNAEMIKEMESPEFYKDPGHPEQVKQLKLDEEKAKKLQEEWLNLSHELENLNP